MIISVLIRALVEENSVTITGFGTFSIKKLPAQIKDEIIFPPQHIITFEYAENDEGFDFVSKFSKWKQIRIDEAQDEISKWIEYIVKGVERNQTISYDDFGTFFKNQLGQIIFEGALNSQLNFENEGYEPIILAAKIQEENFGCDVFTNIEKEKRGNIKQFLQDKRTVYEKNNKKKNDRILFVMTIIVVIAILFALFYKEKLITFYRTVFEEKVGLFQEAAEIEDSAYTKDSAKDVKDMPFIPGNNLVENVAIGDLGDKKSELKKNEDHHLSQTPYNEAQMQIRFEKGKYYVIAGSFANEENALRLIQNEKLENYNPKFVVLPNSKLYRVCIGVFEDEKDAISFAEQFKKNYWVMK
jgi:nucleoid DNA-binding protein